MSIETVLISAVVVIATAAAVIKFALFEWEGILQAWVRVTTPGRRRRRKAGL